MGKKTKEVSVFSMSAIDLFCSALGAFMIIAIIAMPYYAKEEIPVDLNEIEALKESIEKTKEELEQIQSSNAEKMAELSQKQAQSDALGDEIDEIDAKITEAAKALNGSFLIIVSSWETKDAQGKSDDIDMYVKDPKENSYDYRNKRVAGIDAEFAEDSRKAVGIEVWETSSAMSGTYEVLFISYLRNISIDTVVKLRIYTKDGKLDLEDAIVGARRYSNTYYITMDDKGKASVVVKNVEVSMSSAADKPPASGN